MISKKTNKIKIKISFMIDNMGLYLANVLYLTDKKACTYSYVSLNVLKE